MLYLWCVSSLQGMEEKLTLVLFECIGSVCVWRLLASGFACVFGLFALENPWNATPSGNHGDK